LEENKIAISKHCYFDTESGYFYLNNETSEVIYREKGIICSYSGANEWCNHFMCELIDLFSGSSQYNYALGTTIHEKEIPKIWKDNKQSVIDWINKSKAKDWFKAAAKMFDEVIDNLPNLND
jgi:hypothetical protein